MRCKISNELYLYVLLEFSIHYFLETNQNLYFLIFFVLRVGLCDKSVFSEVFLFIGIYIAVKFSYLVGNVIGDGNSKSVKVVAFLITKIAVIICIHLLAKLLSGIASTLFLGWLNKLGGAFFAVLKTILLLGIVLSLFQKININNALISKQTQEKSLFFNPILKTSEVLLPVLTDWFKGLKSSVAEDETNATD